MSQLCLIIILKHDRESPTVEVIVDQIAKKNKEKRKEQCLYKEKGIFTILKNNSSIDKIGPSTVVVCETKTTCGSCKYEKRLVGMCKSPSLKEHLTALSMV